MIIYITLVFVIAIVCVSVLFAGVKDLTRALPDPEDYNRLQRLHEQNHAQPYDALRAFVFDYLDDKYSQFAPIQPTSYLIHDLGMDSLDLSTVMTDIGYVTATDLHVHEFMNQYGINSTVSDLIKYVRSKQSE